MKKYFTASHKRNCKVVQFKCMGCHEEIFAVGDMKGVGVSECPFCKNNHQVTTYKNGKHSVKNLK